MGPPPAPAGRGEGPDSILGLDSAFVVRIRQSAASSWRPRSQHPAAAQLLHIIISARSRLMNHLSRNDVEKTETIREKARDSGRGGAAPSILITDVDIRILPGWKLPHGLRGGGSEMLTDRGC